MTTLSAIPELAEPYLRQVLSTAGLDVEYVRGAGNTLYRRGGDGDEIPVVDYVGGYGSLLLGHNNPEIVDYAKSLLDAQTPVHAQFSRHPYANDVAAALNRILHRELGGDEPYFAIFANSGAEAIEAAIKHAELERVVRLTAIGAAIDAHVEHARAAMLRGDGTIANGGGIDRFEELVAEVNRTNAALFASAPLFLAPEGSFHGKLAGSVQLTHNEGYRMAFKGLAAQALFIPIDRPGALQKIVDENRANLLDITVDNGVVKVVERDFPRFCAFVVEPIQGEGGIHELSAAFAQEIQRVCAEIGCPVIVDEIQSGMGRTGKFLASTRIGLHGDYYTMAKSLGGGVAKAAVLLIRESRYHRDFELMHSSTFAKDSFSCLIASKVLEILEAGDGEVYRRAAERGSALLTMLRSVHTDFPEVVKDARGRGLMLGLEFHDQSNAASEAIRELARSGFFGYYLAGHLLRAHGVRTFPTSSAVYTLRFEPSVYLTNGEIDLLESALRDLCAILRDQDGQRLAPAG